MFIKTGTNMMKIILSLFLLISAYPTFCTVTWSQKEIDEHTTELSASFDLAPDDFVYQEYLHLTCDNPELSLSPISISHKATDQYDTRFKENKKHINQSFQITCIAHHEAPLSQPAHLNLSYFKHSNKQITNEVYTVNQAPTVATAAAADDLAPEQTHPVCAPCQKEKKSWSETISDLITDTDSLLLRLILVILLGILMSLTPCIYPMIPITVGILQSQASGSWIRNFSRALAYTMGIATTFAILGLLAAFTGQIFGSIMANPIFIIIIVLLLAYLAGSMLGLYEMYIPRFMQPKQNGIQGSSLIAAFIFGAVSGTVASPCLSPGLVLLLTLVTTLGSKFMGFLLLFSFGIGLSIPLLLIGTFSSSINVLPRSGMWMIEIKRAFGLIMLLMCFYFLNNIMPWHMLLWGISIFSLSAGILYLGTLRETHSSSGRYMKNILSVGLIAASVFIAAQAFKATIVARLAQASWWCEDYNKTLISAKHNKKLVFLDITAPYCSICKAIESKLFSTDIVRDAICTMAMPVKIDISRETEENKHLKNTFGIMGAPVFFLINPENESVVAHWAGEIYDFTPEEFARVLQHTQQKAE